MSEAPERVLWKRERSYLFGVGYPGHPLSNFSPMPVRAAQTVWPTSEALYQALKFPHDARIQEQIRCAPHPRVAKNLARTHRDRQWDDWERVKLAAMNWVLARKCEDHDRTIRVALEESAGRDIVEVSRTDDFWGAIQRVDGLRGKNCLGRLWMLVRLPLDEGVPVTAPVHEVRQVRVTLLDQEFVLDDVKGWHTARNEGLKKSDG